MLVRITKLIPWLLLFAVMAGWFLFLRPESIGGSTGYIVVAGKSMVPTLHMGDLAITRTHSEYVVGDIVTFPVKGQTVIHRIVGGTVEGGFITRGDGNSGRDDSWLVASQDIMGSLWFHIPNGGTYIVNLLSYLREPLFRGFLAGSLIVLFLGDTVRKTRRSRSEIRNRRMKHFHKSRRDTRI